MIKRGKYGLLFWFLSCFIGSITVVEIERYELNDIKGFNMPISEGIVLWFFITLLTLIVSSPLILLIYFLSKKTRQLAKIITLTLLIAFIITYFITVELSRSYFEAFYITSPYFLLAFIFEFIYLKIERSLTSATVQAARTSPRESTTKSNAEPLSVIETP